MELIVKWRKIGVSLIYWPYMLLRMALQKLFKTRKKKVWGFLLILTTFVYSFHRFIKSENEFWSPAGGQFNYFEEADQYSKSSRGYLINTSSCQILNIDPWDKSIKHLFKEIKPADCYGTHKHWTYVNGSTIVVNKTALTISGFSFDSISCCYKTIRRVEQSSNYYDARADSKVRFSSTCQQMSEKTQMKSQEEFVKVVCSSKYWPFRTDVIYRQFHALALPYQNSRVIEKINWWRENSGSVGVRPPNVAIIGVDSMSRLSFHRSFPKTKQVLEKLGAFEMLGYTKVGDNTLPNAIPFLTGFSLEQIEKMCFFTSHTKFDNCPFIWKDFSDAKYLTSHNEDTPFLTSFNYEKTGFVEQPTDFYLRPFMLGVSEHTDNVRFTFDCIGYNTVYDTVTNYNIELLKLAHSTNTPIFISSWITSLAHQDLNAARFADNAFVDFFQGLEANGILENTLLFFISDHGYRYGTIRQTFPGWYEDKLPFSWVYVPPLLKKRLPNDVDSILNTNSRRLSSPFDLYHTMKQVLEMFKNSNLNSTTIPSIPRTIGQSLFQEIPEERACTDAGISSSYCACVMPVKVELNDTFLINSAKTVVTHLNKILPPQCEPLNVSNVSGGAVIKKKNDTNTFVVTFRTEPGNFLLEANVDVRGGKDFQVSGNVLRLSKIVRDASCAKNSILELYCYCK